MVAARREWRRTAGESGAVMAWTGESGERDRERTALRTRNVHRRAGDRHQAEIAIRRGPPLARVAVVASVGRGGGLDLLSRDDEAELLRDQLPHELAVDLTGFEAHAGECSAYGFGERGV
jgi:hypothetical protein